MLAATIIHGLFALGFLLGYLHVRKKTANCLPGENERKLDKTILLGGLTFSIFSYILVALAIYFDNNMVAVHTLFITWIVAGIVGLIFTWNPKENTPAHRPDKTFMTFVLISGIVMYGLSMLAVTFG